MRQTGTEGSGEGLYGEENRGLCRSGVRTSNRELSLIKFGL